ncbi:hypothetical protein V6N13_127209 [Hibiscus sabdariffa]
MYEFAFEDFLLEEKKKGTRETCKRPRRKEKKRQEEEKSEGSKQSRQSTSKGGDSKRQEILEQLMKKAARLVCNIWFIEPNKFREADKVKLCYDKTPGPLAHANELWAHGGHNNWRDGLTIVGKLVRSEGEGGGDWWYAEGTFDN